MCVAILAVLVGSGPAEVERHSASFAVHRSQVGNRKGTSPVPKVGEKEAKGERARATADSHSSADSRSPPPRPWICSCRLSCSISNSSASKNYSSSNSQFLLGRPSSQESSWMLSLSSQAQYSRPTSGWEPRPRAVQLAPCSPHYPWQSAPRARAKVERVKTSLSSQLSPC